MTWITPSGNLLNEYNNLNLRNMQRYTHTIRWQFDSNEEFISARIIDDSETHIPKGLLYTINNNSIVIEGLPVDVDLYHPAVKTYLYSGFRLDGTEFKDDESDLKATIEDIMEQYMHYTGKSWCNKGIAGYYADNHTLIFNFTVEVNYKIYSNSENSSTSTSLTSITARSERDFSMMMLLNLDPNIFCFKYGNSNDFTNDLGVKIGYDEYLEIMKSKGYDFLLIDRSDPANV